MSPADAFREVMADVATPVSVVTALRDGAPHGTTVSAFASLSMSPPMLLVALDRRSDLLARLEHGQPFGVNVLGAHQAGLAAAFARKGADRFDGIEWTVDSGARAWPAAPAGSPARWRSWSTAATTSSSWATSCTPRRRPPRRSSTTPAPSARTVPPEENP